MRHLANLLRTTPHVCPSTSAMPRQNPCPNCIFISRLGARMQRPFEILYQRASLTPYTPDPPADAQTTALHPTQLHAANTEPPKDLHTAITVLLLRDSPAGALFHELMPSRLPSAIWSSPHVPD